MRKYMLTLMCAILVVSGIGCSKEESQPGTSQEPFPAAGEAQPQKPAGSQQPVKTKEGKALVKLSIIALEPSMTEAVQKFEAANPDIHIELKPLVQSQSISNIEVDKFNNQMRTELLSGKGADLYQADGDTVALYASKKLLANLSELMSADTSFDKSLYFTNILEGSKINGSLYGMPLTFSFPSLLLGDEDAIQAAGIAIDDQTWTWEQFGDYASKLMKANKGSPRYGLNSAQAEHMLMMRLHENYQNFVDVGNRKANFQSDAFKSMMEQIKNMYADKILTSERTNRSDSFFLPVVVARPQDYFNEMSWYKKGKLYLKPRPTMQKESVPFNVYSMMVINGKSEVKEEAWKFIQFLMSEEMQSSPNFYGFPINKAAYRKQVDELRKSVKNGSLPVEQNYMMTDLDGNELKMPSTVKVTDQDFDNMEKLVSGANTLSISDSKVEEIAYEEAKAYFSGQKSADEVAKLIQNRVTTYLNE